MNNQVSKSKSLLLSLLLIIGISFSISAQDGKEVSKEISENYKVTKDFTLGIESKYGSIDIVKWDKNELEVVVEMKVKASSEDKANKILEKIDIDINEGSAGVDLPVVEYADETIYMVASAQYVRRRRPQIGHRYRIIAAGVDIHAVIQEKQIAVIIIGQCC